MADDLKVTLHLGDQHYTAWRVIANDLGVHIDALFLAASDIGLLHYDELVAEVARRHQNNPLP